MGQSTVRVAELFAGVGGFRLGLEGWTGDKIAPEHLPAAGPFEVVWANQREPPGSVPRQFAARCYETHFGKGSVINRDIAAVLDDAEVGRLQISDVDMVVGGFPCQDYSVAKPLSFSGGIEGKKGVLWWQIHSLAVAFHPLIKIRLTYPIMPPLPQLVKPKMLFGVNSVHGTGQSLPRPTSNLNRLR